LLKELFLQEKIKKGFKEIKIKNDIKFILFLYKTNNLNMENIEQNTEQEENTISTFEMEEFIKQTLKTNSMTFVPIENPIILKKIYDLFQNSSENNINLECSNSEYSFYCGVYFSIKQNLKQIKYWYTKASELGNANGMNKLGVYYEEVENNAEQGKYWYTKASELGNTNAMGNLGLYYKNFENDSEQSKYWYEKASELGNEKAMNNLGFYYQFFEKNMEQAKLWYEKASELGSTLAMINLGIFYKNVEKNTELEKYWYEKACELEDTNAMNNLGLYYYNVEKDMKQAKHWLGKASILGNSISTISYLKLCNQNKTYYDLFQTVTLNQLQNQFPKFNHFWAGRKKYITQGECSVCYDENKELIPFDCLHHSYCLPCYLSMDKCGQCSVIKSKSFMHDELFC